MVLEREEGGKREKHASFVPTRALTRDGAHNPLVLGGLSNPLTYVASTVLNSVGLTWQTLTASSMQDRDALTSTCSGQLL